MTGVCTGSPPSRRASPRPTVSAASFKTVVTPDVAVRANEVRRVDFSMQIAATSESIEVSAAAGHFSNRQSGRARGNHSRWR